MDMIATINMKLRGIEVESVKINVSTKERARNLIVLKEDVINMRNEDIEELIDVLCVFLIVIGLLLLNELL